MRKLKCIVFVLLLILSLTACQAAGQEDNSALKEELAGVKAELSDTKETLKRVEEELAELKAENEREMLDLFEKPEIENKEVKVAAIEASIKELSTLIQNSHDSKDMPKLLEDFSKRQSIDICNVYFGTTEDIFSVYPEIELPDNYRFTERPVYLGALDNDPYIAELYVDIFENRVIQTVSKAIYVDGELVGVVGIDAFID